MERHVNLHFEKLPEDYYWAASDSIQGLLAQGRTMAEAIEIAEDPDLSFCVRQLGAMRFGTTHERNDIRSCRS